MALAGSKAAGLRSIQSTPTTTPSARANAFSSAEVPVHWSHRGLVLLGSMSWRPVCVPPPVGPWAFLDLSVFFSKNRCI